MSNTIPIIIEESTGIKRHNEPVTVGIPFTGGLLRDESRLELHDSKCGCLPLQTQTLAKWPDGSAKWVLLDFQASIDANTVKELELTLIPSATTDKDSIEISINPDADRFSVNTGKASFLLNTKIFKPFDRVVIGENDILNSSNSKIVLTDESGTEYDPHINNIFIETEGKLRTTIKVEGEFRSFDKPAFANFFSRVSFYANSTIVKIDFTIHNPRAAKHPGGLWDLGDPGSIFFKDLSIYSALSCYQPTAMGYELNNEPSTISYQLNDDPSAKNHQLSAISNELIIYQDSSGGENWKSLNHVNRDGVVKNAFRGYRVFSNNDIIKEGLRANPTISIKDRHRQLSGAVQNFWQNFPKALEVKDNTMIIRMFPHQYEDVFELQGGEQKAHVFYLNFELNENGKTGIEWIQNPLIPRITPEWYSKSMVFGCMVSHSKDSNPEYQKLVDNVIKGNNTFFDRREIIDEYGWRNFGDIYADHEVVGYKGTKPFVSHYNNQYDIINGCLLQYARSGDLRWYQIMADLARHVIDIDIYHTNKDRPDFNGGSFWHTDHFMHAETSTHRCFSRKNAKTGEMASYGGGPSQENCYTTGLCMYYLLTGNVMAKEAVVELADWIISAGKVERSILGILRKVKQAISSLRNEYSRNPGRSQGNSLNALLDAFELTNDRKYLLKAEGIMRKYISPFNNINKMHKQQIEFRWSYLVFLQSVGKYLDIKNGMNEQDKMFKYARESLLHHAKWMLEKEVPYKQLFHVVEIPSSTWPAQDVRKSVVFGYAYKYANESLKKAFKERSEYFYGISVSNVLSFEDESMTFARPLAILMHYGIMHTYFQNNEEK